MSKGQEMMREEFEDWAESTGLSIDRCSHIAMFLNGSRREKGDYILEESFRAWEAWQAARQQAPAEQSPVSRRSAYEAQRCALAAMLSAFRGSEMDRAQLTGFECAEALFTATSGNLEKDESRLAEHAEVPVDYHQMAFEMGGTEAGCYLLESEELDQIVQAVLYAAPVDQGAPAPAQDERLRNRHGIDGHYFGKNLSRIVRDFDSFTPDELARCLARLACVAAESILSELEFARPAQTEQQPEQSGLEKALRMIAGINCKSLHYHPSHMSRIAREALAALSAQGGE